MSSGKGGAGRRPWQPMLSMPGALMILCGMILLVLRRPSAPGSGLGSTQYSYVLGLTSHKTGTRQLQCIANAVSDVVTGIPVSDWYIKKRTGEGIAEARALVNTAPGRPCMFLGVHPMLQTCYGQFETKTRFRCPWAIAPCKADRSPVLSLEGCHIELPAMDDGAVGVVHFYRNPWDVVTSAYWYHLEQPPENFIKHEFGKLAELITSSGVPETALAELGIGDEERKTPFGELLASLPEERGIQLQFWHSAKELYEMARQYRILRQHSGATQIRFEDAQRNFRGTVLPMLRRYYPQDADAIMRRAQELKCDPTTWSSSEVSSSNHITTVKHPPGSKERLQRVLWEQPEIRRHLCLLSREMGYTPPLPCSEA